MLILFFEGIFIGPAETSIAEAKNSAYLRVIEELGFHMPAEEEDIPLKKTSSVLSPCYALHHLMLKQNVHFFSFFSLKNSIV